MSNIDQLLYVSPPSRRSLFQAYRIYRDRIEIDSRLALRTLCIAVADLVHVDVRRPPVIGDTFRGHTLRASLALKLDFADFFEHVAIETRAPFLRYLRITPDHPDAFVSALRALMPPIVDSQPATAMPRRRAVDLDPGEACRVTLCDGQTIDVELIDVAEREDSIVGAVRDADVRVRVNGREVLLGCGNYHLPTTVNAVRLDCPITSGYRTRTNFDRWGLFKRARLRLWPADTEIEPPERFVLPLNAAWLSSTTQSGNEPVFVDGGDRPGQVRTYYHDGHDMGGVEGDTEIVAAVAGRLISYAGRAESGIDPQAHVPRADRLAIRDDYGWLHIYSHLKEIADLEPGQEIAQGQHLGTLGKQGSSGGWSHLHYLLKAIQPSGAWGTEDAYAYLWAAWRHQHDPALVAVARPHQLARVGDVVVLDSTRSWSRSGKHEATWILSDGSQDTGTATEIIYTRAGVYSEVLRLRDADGHEDYDFAVVHVLDTAPAGNLPPTLHAAFHPTENLRVDQPVTFVVRSFRSLPGEETWDFGDGSPTVRVTSDANRNPHAADGYARVSHHYAAPGHYVACVTHTAPNGLTATMRLHIEIGTG